MQIGALLNARKAFPVFTIQAAQGSYWRMAALEHLDPATATFESLPEPAEPVEANDTLPGADTAGTPVEQHVSVEASLEDFPYVVAAARPTSVSIDTTWQPNAQTLTVPSALDDGTQYTVTSTYVNPTAEELRQVPMPAPTDFQEAADYPATDYPAAIRQTALTWTRGKTTLFDKVLAIQDALRGPRWTYNTNVAYPASPVGVTEFLSRTGGVLSAIRHRDGVAPALHQHPGPRRDRLHRGIARPERCDAVPRQHERHPQLGGGALRLLRVADVRTHARGRLRRSIDERLPGRPHR